jgi:hypothetical protein
MTRRPEVWGTLLIILIMVVSACSFPSLATEPVETEAVSPPDVQATEEPAPDDNEAPPGPPPGDLPSELICDPIEPGTLFYVVCNVRDAFLSRNTAALPGYLTDPFYVSYYQSEGRETDIDGAVRELQGELPEDTSQMEFIIDQENFPPSYGVPWENYMPYEDNLELVVYSTGWGSDGSKEVMLYFIHDADGHFKLGGVLVSNIGFD